MKYEQLNSKKSAEVMDKPKPKVFLAEEREQMQISRLIDDVAITKRAIGEEFKSRKAQQKSEPRVGPHDDILKTTEANIVSLN